MKARRSSGLALTIRPIRPCSMIEYARVPTPVPRNSSVMSISRQAALLISYSLSPLRKSRRVTVISPKPAYCGGTRRPSFWKVRETSAMPAAVAKVAALRLFLRLCTSREMGAVRVAETQGLRRPLPGVVDADPRPAGNPRASAAGQHDQLALRIAEVRAVVRRLHSERL